MEYEIVQDERDQLRQEYVDMGKKTTPKREELTDQGDTPHFAVSEFNSSERVGGGKYEYILNKILAKLEQVRSKAGHIPMTINSGFRNPYKHHIKLGLKTKESPHLYGMATDIRLMDFNQDGKVDDWDRNLLAKAAKALGSCVEPKDNRGRVHIDWRVPCPAGW